MRHDVADHRPIKWHSSPNRGKLRAAEILNRDRLFIGMEQHRYFYILVLAVFVIAGRKFLDSWRDDSPKGRKRRLIFGGLCLACFLVVAFFEIRL